MACSSVAPVEGLYNLVEFFSGKPVANKEILRLPLTKACSFKTNLLGSRGASRVAATALIQFNIAKNSTNFGAMTFAAGSNVGTFASSSPVAFAFGDVLTVTTPSTADATLEDLGFMLAGVVA